MCCPAARFCNTLCAAALALPPGARVLVHDYTKRAHYADVESVLQRVMVADSLAVFEVRGDEASRSAALALYERYKFDPR